MTDILPAQQAATVATNTAAMQQQQAAARATPPPPGEVGTAQAWNARTGQWETYSSVQAAQAAQASGAFCPMSYPNVASTPTSVVTASQQSAQLAQQQYSLDPNRVAAAINERPSYPTTVNLQSAPIYVNAAKGYIPSDVMTALGQPQYAARYQEAKNYYEGATGHQIGGGDTAAPGVTGSVHVSSAGVVMPNVGANERGSNPNYYSGSTEYSLIAGSPSAGFSGQNTSVPRALMPFVPENLTILNIPHGETTYAIPTSSLATNNPWNPTIVNQRTTDIVNKMMEVDLQTRSDYVKNATTLDQVLENKIAQAAAYHEAAAALGIPVAANPYEYASDVALTIFKGTGSRDYTNLGQSLQPSQIASVMPAGGVGLQDIGWKAGIGLTEAAFYPAFAAFEAISASGDMGSYGKLYGGSEYKGTVVNKPLQGETISNALNWMNTVTKENLNYPAPVMLAQSNVQEAHARVINVVSDHFSSQIYPAGSLTSGRLIGGNEVAGIAKTADIISSLPSPFVSKSISGNAFPGVAGVFFTGSIEKIGSTQGYMQVVQGSYKVSEQRNGGQASIGDVALNTMGGIINTFSFGMLPAFSTTRGFGSTETTTERQYTVPGPYVAYAPKGYVSPTITITEQTKMVTQDQSAYEALNSAISGRLPKFSQETTLAASQMENFPIGSDQWKASLFIGGLQTLSERPMDVVKNASLAGVFVAGGELVGWGATALTAGTRVAPAVPIIGNVIAAGMTAMYGFSVAERSGFGTKPYALGGILTTEALPLFGSGYALSRLGATSERAAAAQPVKSVVETKASEIIMAKNAAIESIPDMSKIISRPSGFSVAQMQMAYQMKGLQYDFGTPKAYRVPDPTDFLYKSKGIPEAGGIGEGYPSLAGFSKETAFTKMLASKTPSFKIYEIGPEYGVAGMENIAKYSRGEISPITGKSRMETIPGTNIRKLSGESVLTQQRSAFEKIPGTNAFRISKSAPEEKVRGGGGGGKSTEPRGGGISIDVSTGGLVSRMRQRGSDISDMLFGSGMGYSLEREGISPSNDYLKPNWLKRINVGEESEVIYRGKIPGVERPERPTGAADRILFGGIGGGSVYDQLQRQTVSIEPAFNVSSSVSGRGAGPVVSQMARIKEDIEQRFRSKSDIVQAIALRNDRSTKTSSKIFQDVMVKPITSAKTKTSQLSNVMQDLVQGQVTRQDLLQRTQQITQQKPADIITPNPDIINYKLKTPADIFGGLGSGGGSGSGGGLLGYRGRGYKNKVVDIPYLVNLSKNFAMGGIHKVTTHKTVNKKAGKKK